MATRKATASPATAAPWFRMSASPLPWAAASVTLETDSQTAATAERNVT